MLQRNLLLMWIAGGFAETNQRIGFFKFSGQTKIFLTHKVVWYWNPQGADTTWKCITVAWSTQIQSYWLQNESERFSSFTLPKTPQFCSLRLGWSSYGNHSGMQDKSFLFEMMTRSDQLEWSLSPQHCYNQTHRSWKPCLISINCK